MTGRQNLSVIRVQEAVIEGEAPQALPVEGATLAPGMRGRLHPASPVEGACHPRSSVGSTSMGKDDAGTRLRQLMRLGQMTGRRSLSVIRVQEAVIEGEAPQASPVRLWRGRR
jgi:hypothetical protein